MRLKVPKCMALAFGLQALLASDSSSRTEGVLDPHLMVGDQCIPLMAPTGFKYLGKLFDPSLTEGNVKLKIQTLLRQWLSKIDTTPLTGAMKCWVYNQFVIPKLSWYFTIYNLSSSFVKAKLHASVLPFLKNLCGIPKGGNTAILFCGTPDYMGLSLKLVYTVYKACQVTRRVILQRSLDPTARLIFELELAKQLTWSGPRFAAAREVSTVEAFGKNVENPPLHHGLGFRATSHYIRCKTSAFSYFAAIDKEEIISHSDSLVMQGKIRSLDNTMKMDRTWKRFLYDYPQGLFKFKLNATNNTLPTADNIRRWTNEHVSKHCAGCQRSCPTLEHVLTGCPAFLFQGRYKWRHDSGLSTIFSALSSFLSNISHDSEDSTYLSFVKEGQKHCLDQSHPGASVPRRKLRSGSLGNFQD
eukprot:jgi/Botrbrau1/16096/Bobra.7_2s0062.1